MPAVGTPQRAKRPMKGGQMGGQLQPIGGGQMQRSPTPMNPNSGQSGSWTAPGVTRPAPRPGAGWGGMMPGRGGPIGGGGWGGMMPGRGGPMGPGPRPLPPSGGGGQIPGYNPGMVRPPQPGYGLPQLPVNGGMMGGGQLNPQMIQLMMQLLQGGGGMYR